MTELLTTDEHDRLAENEMVIERGIQTFTEVGNALLAIRDGRLYRVDFGTFEDYCRERWGFTRDFAYKTIRAAEVTTGLVDHGLQAPTSERQARELARVPEPERADVWRETVERTGGKPTAAAIRETHRPAAATPYKAPDLPHDPAPEPLRSPATEPGIWDASPPAPTPKRTLMDAIEERVPGSKAEVRATNIRARLSRAAAGCADITLIDTGDAGNALAADEIDTAAWQIERAATWIAALKKSRSGLRVVGGTE